MNTLGKNKSLIVFGHDVKYETSNLIPGQHTSVSFKHKNLKTSSSRPLIDNAPSDFTFSKRLGAKDFDFLLTSEFEDLVKKSFPKNLSGDVPFSQYSTEDPKRILWYKDRSFDYSNRRGTNLNRSVPPVVMEEVFDFLVNISFYGEVYYNDLEFRHPDFFDSKSSFINYTVRNILFSKSFWIDIVDDVVGLDAVYLERLATDIVDSLNSGIPFDKEEKSVVNFFLFWFYALTEDVYYLNELTGRSDKVYSSTNNPTLLATTCKLYSGDIDLTTGLAYPEDSPSPASLWAKELGVQLVERLEAQNDYDSGYEDEGADEIIPVLEFYDIPPGLLSADLEVEDSDEVDYGYSSRIIDPEDREPIPLDTLPFNICPEPEQLLALSQDEWVNIMKISSLALFHTEPPERELIRYWTQRRFDVSCLTGIVYPPAMGPQPQAFVEFLEGVLVPELLAEELEELEAQVEYAKSYPDWQVDLTPAEQKEHLEWKMPLINSFIWKTNDSPSVLKRHGMVISQICIRRMYDILGHPETWPTFEYYSCGDPNIWLNFTWYYLSKFVDIKPTTSFKPDLDPIEEETLTAHIDVNLPSNLNITHNIEFGAQFTAALQALTNGLSNLTDNCKARILNWAMLLFDLFSDVLLFEHIDASFRTAASVLMSIRWGIRASSTGSLLLRAFRALISAFTDKPKPTDAPTEANFNFSSLVCSFDVICEFSSKVLSSLASIFGFSPFVSHHFTNRSPLIVRLATSLKSCETIYSFVCTLVGKLFDTFENWVGEWIPILKRTPDLTARVRQWTKDTEKFFIVENKEGKFERANLRYEGAKVDCLRAYRDGNNLLSLLSVSPKTAHLYDFVKMRVRELNGLLTNIEASAFSVSKKVAPVVIYITGPPGIGKSTIIDSLASVVFKTRGWSEYSRDAHRYQRAPNSDYYSGYCGQPVFVCDDFGASKMEEHRTSEFLDVMRLATDVPASLNMADLSSKGATFFHSELFVMTSNLAPSKEVIEKYIQSADAFLRRIDFFITPVPPAEILGNRGVDPNKVNGISYEGYTFEYTAADGSRKAMTFEELCTQVAIVGKNREKRAAAEVYNTCLTECELARIKERYEKAVNPPTEELESQGVFDFFSKAPGLPERTVRFDSEIGVDLGYPEMTEDTNPFGSNSRLSFDHADNDDRTELAANEPLYRDFIERKIDKSYSQLAFDWLRDVASCVPLSTWIASLTLLTALPVALGVIRLVYKHFRNSVEKTPHLDVGSLRAPVEALEPQGSSWDTFDYTHEGCTSTVHSHFCDVCHVRFTHCHLLGDVYTFTHCICEDCKKLKPVQDLVVEAQSEVPPHEGIYGKKKGKVQLRSLNKAKRKGPTLHAQADYVAAVSKLKVPIRDTNSQSENALPADTNVTEFFNHAVADPNAVNVVGALLSNLGTLTVLSSGATMHCLRLKAHYVICPEHLFHGIDYDKPVKLRFGSQFVHNVDFMLDLSKAMFIEGADVALFELPKDLPPARDVLKHFATAHSLRSRFHNAFMPRFVPGSSHKMTNTAHLTELKRVGEDINYSIVDQKGEKTTLSVVEGWYYKGAVAKGDCGSPVVAVDPGMSRKVLGLHIAGSPSSSNTTGRCNCLTYEDLLETIRDYETDFDTKPTERELPDLESQVHSEKNLHLGVDDQVVDFVGTLQRSFVKSETKLRKSPIFGVFPPTKAPSAQRPVKIGSQIVKPLEKAVFQSSVPEMYFSNIKLLDRAEKVICEKIASFPHDPTVPRRVLTEDEAINGLIDDFGQKHPTVLPMALNKSPGYPFIQLVPASTKKDWFQFENGKHYPNKTLTAKIEKTRQCLLDGKVPDAVFVEFLKDEKRDLEKVELAKTRSIANCPLDLVILVRQYFLSFIANFMKDPALGFVAVGLNPHGDDWTRLYNRMVRFLNHIAGDYKAWDKLLNYQFCMRFANVVSSWYNDGEQNAKVRELICIACFSSLRSVDGKLIQLHHGMPSGVPFTATGNSVINALVITAAILDSLSCSDDEAHVLLLNEVEMTFYGDDHWISVSDEIAKSFNMQFLQRWLKSNIGMNYTDPAKNQDIPAFIELDKLTYLKRKFVQNDYVVLAPMDLDVIQQSLNYVQAGLDPVLAVQDIVDAVMLELTHHGKTTFNEQYSIIRRCCALNGISLPTYSYDKCYWRLHNDQVVPGLYKDEVTAFLENAIISEKHHISGVRRGLNDELLEVEWCPRLNRVQSGERHHVCKLCNMNALRTVYTTRGNRLCPVCAGMFNTLPKWFYHPLNCACRTSITSAIAQASLEAQVGEADTETAGIHTAETVVQNPTAFMDQSNSETTSAYLERLPLPVDPYKKQTITDFLERPFFVETFEWTDTFAKGADGISNIIGKAWNIPYVVFENTYVWDKLKNFEWFHCENAEIQFRINGIPFHYGTLVASAFPMAGDLLLASRSTADKSGYCNLFTLTNNPHVKIQPTQNEVVTLTVPWNCPKNFIDLRALTKRDSKDPTKLLLENKYEHFACSMATVLVAVLNPLSSTMKTTSKVSISVFVKLNGVSLRGYSVDAQPYAPAKIPATTYPFKSIDPTEVIFNSYGSLQVTSFFNLPVESYLTEHFYVPYIASVAKGNETGKSLTYKYTQVVNMDDVDATFQGGLYLGLIKDPYDDADDSLRIAENLNNLKDLENGYSTVFIPGGLKVFFIVNGTEQTLTCFWGVRAKDTWKDGKAPRDDWDDKANILLLAPSRNVALSWVTNPLRKDGDDGTGPIVGAYTSLWLDDYWTNVTIDDNTSDASLPSLVSLITKYTSGDNAIRSVVSSLIPAVVAQSADSLAQTAKSASSVSRKEASRNAPKKLSWWESAKGYIAAGFEVAGDVLQVVGTVASIAAMAGLSVPPTNEPPTNALLGVHNLSHGSGVRSATNLSVDPQAALDNLTGSGLNDSMMISNIVTKRGLLGTVKVIPGVVHTEPLVTIPVHPMNCSLDPARLVNLHTYLSFVASAFEFSRCQIKFHFEVVCSAFHSMRFRVSFIPAEGADSTEYNDDGDLSNVISDIFDVQTNSVFDFEVPYLRDYNYLPNVYDGLLRQNSAGFISVSILNSLVVGGEDDAAPVFINIYTSASSGAQFAKPTGRRLCTLSEPQSKQRYRRAFPENFDLPKLYAQADDVPQIQTAECLERGINCGEQMISLKPLVSRYGLHAALPPREMFGGFGAIVNFDTQSIWQHHVTDDRGELYDNGFFTTRPDPTMMPFWNYFQQIFRGRRGSMAVKYLPSAEDNTNVQITAFNAREMDGTTSSFLTDLRGHQVEPVSAAPIDIYNEGSCIGLATSLSGCEAIVPYYSNLSYIPWQFRTPMYHTKTFGLVQPANYPSDAFPNLRGRILTAAGDDFEYVQLMAPPILNRTDYEPWAPFPLALPKNPTGAVFDIPYQTYEVKPNWKKFSTKDGPVDWTNTDWNQLDYFPGRSLELIS